MSKLHRWAVLELTHLWYELRQAHDQRDCVRTIWTVRCEHLGERIKELTAIIGPVSPSAVPMSAIADGWFSWVNGKLGITNARLPSPMEVEVARQWVARQTQL